MWDFVAAEVAVCAKDFGFARCFPSEFLPYVHGPLTYDTTLWALRASNKTLRVDRLSVRLHDTMYFLAPGTVYQYQPRRSMEQWRLSCIDLPAFSDRLDLLPALQNHDKHPIL